VSASAIYTGTLRHRRYSEVEREFSHPVNFAYLDLDELPTLAGGRIVNPRPGAWRFCRRDYHGSRSVPLDVAVRDTVERQIDERPSGPVRMLTQLRCFGMSFNPVTLYYCFADDGEQLHSVVAEVTNTPWRERHAYVLGPWHDTGVLRTSRPKQLHVSPFIGMSQSYEIAMTVPDRTLSVHIDCRADSGSQFDATLGLQRSELTTAALSRLIRNDPVAPLRTLRRICAQGFALKRAGVTVHPHPTRDQA
jgi:uncharacterized protein